MKVIFIIVVRAFKKCKKTFSYYFFLELLGNVLATSHVSSTPLAFSFPSSNSFLYEKLFRILRNFYPFWEIGAAFLKNSEDFRMLPGGQTNVSEHFRFLGKFPKLAGDFQGKSEDLSTWFWQVLSANVVGRTDWENIILCGPLLKNRNRNLKDTTDFINFIEESKVSHDTVLVSMNVTSLYTNIPQEKGIQTVCRANEIRNTLTATLPSRHTTSKKWSALYYIKKIRSSSTDSWNSHGNKNGGLFC